jgi:hypothetical protein
MTIVSDVLAAAGFYFTLRLVALCNISIILIIVLLTLFLSERVLKIDTYVTQQLKSVALALGVVMGSGLHLAAFYQNQ